MKDKEKVETRKRNMRLFPITKTLGWDYIFFYTTNFLFLTQVKHISAADVVLIDSFYALFGIIMQIPATFIIEYLGRKKSIVLGNFLNCIYMIVVMTSRNLFNLIIAELLSSLAFGIKESAEPALLNESIPQSRYKSKIFAKINEKGMANWYIINGIATILAGFFYDIHPYIPISLSLVITTFVTIISTGFREPTQKNKKAIKVQEFNQIQELKESFKFILKSERLKSLILFSAFATGIISILSNYEISLLEDLNMEAKYLCIIFAVIGFVSGMITKKQEKFHEKHRNKSLSILLFIISISILGAGVFGIIAETYYSAVIMIICFYLLGECYKSILYPLRDRYLRSFANEEIDTKIFVASHFLGSIFSAITGLIASFLLDRMSTAYCMVIMGIIGLIITIMMGKYMKTRVGLKPSEYSKEELKYDELKIK